MATMLPILDMGSVVDLEQGIVPQRAAAGAINGAGIDRMPQGEKGFESGMLIVMAGAEQGAPTARTVDAKIQDSADNVTFADASPAIAITQITAVNTKQVIKFKARNLRKWVRAVVTVGFTGGTAPTIDVAAGIALGGALQTPTAL